MTPLEWALLTYLASIPNRAADRDELLQEVWGYRVGVRTRAVDNLVARLRKKIERHPNKPKHLLSVRSGGYRLVAERTTSSLPIEEDTPGLPRYHDRLRVAAALDQARLVTLTGPGGVGKSWLAHRFTEHHGEEYEGGVARCGLGEISEEESLNQAVASALNAPDVPVEEGLRRRGKLLMVLEDGERLADILARCVPRWLELAPQARILLTSRVPLSIPEECQVAMAPLSEEAAVALYKARALEMGHETADGPELRAIIEQLDRLPLAIELAASLAMTLSAGEFLQRLDQRFRLLKDRGRGRVRRHRTLLAVIESSVALLPDTVRHALVQCSVFEGGFSADAVDAVLDLGEAWPLDALHELQVAHLVRAYRIDGVSRMALYRNVEAWAREQLASDPVLHAATKRRHAEFFAKMGPSSFMADLQTSSGRRSLCRERGNLFSAVEFAVDTADPDLAGALTCAALEVVALQGPPQAVEGLTGRALKLGLPVAIADRILLRALEIHPMQCPPAELETRLQALVERATGRKDAPLASAAAAALGRVLYRLSRWNEAGQAFGEARGFCQEVGDAVGAAKYLVNIGVIRRHLGDWEGARDAFQRALADQHALRNPLGQCDALANLGILWNARGMPVLARGHLEEALRIRLAEYEPMGALIIRINLSYSLLTLGEMGSARSQLESAIETSRELGSSQWEFVALGFLGEVDALTGRFAEAEASYLSAEQFHRGQGNAYRAAIALGNRGQLYWRMGDVDDARRCLERAVEALLPLGRQAATGTYQGTLASVFSYQGDAVAAAELVDEACERLRETRHVELARVICRRGTIALAAGNRPLALASLDEAEELSRHMGLGSRAPLSVALADLREALSEGGTPS